MNYDVTIDRERYVGGSDLPAIFNISPFKTRWQLLLEKAEPSEHPSGAFSTPEIEYGNEMEPKIRAYINESWGANYEPDQRIKGDLRANVDGYDGQGSILEIKTTSHIKSTVNEYKHYLVQLLFYMMIYEAQEGVLAVYERPKDFNPEFDEGRLSVFCIDKDDYEYLCEEIEQKIDKFRLDLKRIKDNPLLTEQDLQPKEVVEAANWVLAIEEQLEFYKRMQEEEKAAKKKLKDSMDKFGLTKWITDSGMRIANVPDGVDSIVKEFDFERFSHDHPELVEEYQVEKVKKGRSGYLRVTLP